MFRAAIDTCGCPSGSSRTSHGRPRSTCRDGALVGAKHTKAAAADISLTGDGELKGISAAWTGAKKDPKYVALQVVIDRTNDLFGAESFAESQGSRRRLPIRSLFAVS